MPEQGKFFARASASKCFFFRCHMVSLCLWFARARMMACSSNNDSKPFSWSLLEHEFILVRAPCSSSQKRLLEHQRDWVYLPNSEKKILRKCFFCFFYLGAFLVFHLIFPLNQPPILHIKQFIFPQLNLPSHFYQTDQLFNFPHNLPFHSFPSFKFLSLFKSSPYQTGPKGADTSLLAWSAQPRGAFYRKARELRRHIHNNNISSGRRT